MPTSPADRRAAQRRRQLNLTILEISRERGLARPLEIACECGHPQCWEIFPLDRAAFGALLASGRDALAPLHHLRETREPAGAPRLVAAAS
jgi:hypothetical protein